MKNKGFTLIELLAVIVVLAIIALIAVPMILGVVEKSKKGAAVSSAYGYIDAIEKYMLLHTLDSTKYPVELKAGETYQVSKKEFKSTLAFTLIDKVYAEDIIHINDFINIKGNKPTSGIITIGNKNTVSNAKVVTNSYLVECNGKKCEAKRKMVVDKTAPVVTLGEVTSTRKTITINYQANDPESGIDQVKCYYKRDSESSYNSVVGNNGVCNISGLNAGTEYTYKIEATNGDGVNSNVTGTFKTKNSPCKITSQVGSELAVGDTITCGAEEFYYIGEGTDSEEGYVKIFSKLPLDNENKQGITNVNLVYYSENGSYWNNNSNYTFEKYKKSSSSYVSVGNVYDENSYIYQFVESYVNKIKNLGVSNIKGRLIYFQEATVLDDYIKKPIGYRVYWTGSSSTGSNYRVGYYLYCDSGSYKNNECSDGSTQLGGADSYSSLSQFKKATRAIRPVILIPKEEL